MKTTFQTVLCTVAFLVLNTPGLFSQSGAYDIRLVYAPGNSHCEVGVILEIKASDANSQFNIADQNYRFVYDNQVIANPKIDEELFLSGQTSGSFYTEHSLTEDGQTISYNIFLVGGVGFPLSDTDWLQVGKLVFDVVDPAGGTSSLVWNTQSDFPATSVNEMFNGMLFPVTEGSYSSEPLVIPYFNPQKNSGNQMICLNDPDQDYPYRVEGGTGYVWSVFPPGAIDVADSLILVNTIGEGEAAMIRFTNMGLDSAVVTARKETPCDTTEITWTVLFDAEGTWPGDVDYDGVVDWGKDASSYTFAMSHLFVKQQTNPLFETTSRPFDFNGISAGMAPSSSFDWGCHFGEEWKNEDNTAFSYNVDGQSVNMKHADCDGNGILETGTPGYLPVIQPLDSVPGGPLDLDMVARYHSEGVAEHIGNLFKDNNPNDLIKIVPIDTLLPDSSELLLEVRLGTPETQVDNVHSLAFIVQFEFGSYRNPNLILANSHLESPLSMNATDYPVTEDLEPEENPKWFVSLGRQDLSGITFSGEEVCSIICEMTITGLTKSGKSLTKNPTPDTILNISIIDAGMVKADGSYVSLTNASTQIGIYVPFLPLELIHFEAFREGKDVLLHWETANEIDFYGFELERSRDGVSFEPIAWVPAKGQDGGGAFYRYRDEQPVNTGTLYYRMKMVDLDGSFEFSTIAPVTFPGHEFTGVTLYPMPVKDQLIIEFESPSHSEGEFKFYDAVGKKIRTSGHVFSEGHNRLEIDVSNLPNGIYLFALNHGEYQIVQRVVKVSDGP